MIRSDDFAEDTVGMSRVILDSRVMLCTLSMLSNAKLAPITRLVPVETIIVDEASQIEIGDYLPPIHLFHTTLKKLVFIGDDKQCTFIERLVHSLSYAVYSGAPWPRRYQASQEYI